MNEYNAQVWSSFDEDMSNLKEGNFSALRPFTLLFAGVLLCNSSTESGRYAASPEDSKNKDKEIKTFKALAIPSEMKPCFYAGLLISASTMSEAEREKAKDYFPELSIPMASAQMARGEVERFLKATAALLIGGVEHYDRYLAVSNSTSLNDIYPKVIKFFDVLSSIIPPKTELAVSYAGSVLKPSC